MPLNQTYGFPNPLGATRLVDGSWNFAVFSAHATAVDLCFFDAEDPVHERSRVRLQQRTGSVWHGAISGVEAGQHYGFRVHGPWVPEHGHRFNPNKLLIDPYAFAISGRLGYDRLMSDLGNQLTRWNSAEAVPKSILVDRWFDWEGVERPNRSWADTILYELHVAGFTRRFPGIPERLRGTYAGLAHPEAIRYLTDLGITAVQVMPVHHHIDDGHLLEKGLTNYWGYQTIGFFAPETRYAAASPDRGEHVNEFKGMVKALHRAGIEVILDVVYNHTGEGSPEGPTVCFRGLDNFSYYRHERADATFYRDFTGCGNTLDIRHPYVLKLVMDSLRYWVEEMQVDGFRFDLAATLGRESDGFYRDNAFFKAVHQDPVLGKVKLIAEPWDLGPGGYQVGNFPERWAELNGKYRDATRRFWLGHHGMMSEVASRVSGSEDVFGWSRRGPASSVNFITSHDGFTLHDLASYDHKHNEANGEGNRDGDSLNHSWNHGTEGPTDDPAILDRRDRHRRNLMATMLLSLGTPFLLAGDERSRTQQGNNNAYCQDSPISWLDWEEFTPRQRDFFEFTRRLIAFRRSRPEWKRARFFSGTAPRHAQARDLVWHGFGGAELAHRDWGADAPVAFQMVIEGRWLLLVNAAPEPAAVTLPPGSWRPVIDTSLPCGFVDGAGGGSLQGTLEVPEKVLWLLEAADGALA
jgi:glycogen operon protein